MAKTAVKRLRGGYAYVLTVLAIAPAGSCGSTVPNSGSDPGDRGDVEYRIQRVISSLTEVIRVQGEPAKTHTLSERMAYYGVPGVSVAVLANGKLEWARGFGVADAETGAPVTPQTLFQAASISKPVTALGALRLVEEGLIDLDRDVNEYLGEWKVPQGRQSAKSPVTVRRLLSHTAGMTIHGFPGYSAGAVVPTLIQVLNGEPPANTEAVRNDVEPGKEWRYSGGGYTVLQLLMTELTGREFAPLLAEKVFEPLGLKNTTYEQAPVGSRWKDVASAHDERGRRIKGRFHTYPELAAAGLWTTPSDLLAIAAEVQGSLRGRSNRILGREMTELLLTPGRHDWGLGFSTFGSEGRRYFGHGGSNAGFRCRLVASKAGKFGAAVMTNGERGNYLYEELLRAIAVQYDWPGFGG